ncbi:hypothetical protein Q7P36_008797 [Cladosporium allicinum]
MAVKGNNPIFLACFNSRTLLTAGSPSWRAAIAKRVMSVSCENLRKISITLTSRKVSCLENFYPELIDHSESKNPCPETHDSACITITATVARAGKGNRRNVISPPKTDTLSPPTTTAKETSLLSLLHQPDACCPSDSSPNCNNTETTSSFRCQASGIFAFSRNRQPASSFINTAVSYLPPNSSSNLNNPKPLAFSPSSSRHLFFEAKRSFSRIALLVASLLTVDSTLVKIRPLALRPQLPHGFTSHQSYSPQETPTSGLGRSRAGSFSPNAINQPSGLVYVLSKSQGGGPDFDNTHTVAYGTDPDPYGAIPPYQVRCGRWSDAVGRLVSRPQGMLAFQASTTPSPPVPSMAVWLVSLLGRPLAADQARVGS